jgi:2Fe-2S ferredoxin
MPRVRLEPDGIEWEASEGDSLVEVATRHGYYWPVGCPLNGECTNCAFEVVSGLGRISTMGKYERLNLIRQRGPRSIDDPRLRLGCQARVHGDIVVYKRGVQADLGG